MKLRVIDGYWCRGLYGYSGEEIVNRSSVDAYVREVLSENMQKLASYYPGEFTRWIDEFASSTKPIEGVTMVQTGEESMLYVVEESSPWFDFDFESLQDGPNEKFEETFNADLDWDGMHISVPELFDLGEVDSSDSGIHQKLVEKGYLKWEVSL